MNSNIQTMEFKRIIELEAENKKLVAALDSYKKECNSLQNHCTIQYRSLVEMRAEIQRLNYHLHKVD